MHLIFRWAAALACLLALAGAPANAATVSAGDSHSCLVSDANTVRCWGTLAGQELFAQYAQDVRSGRGFSCALLRNGAVACWGANDAGQLGTPAPDARGVMVVSGLAQSASQIATGARHACAAAADGLVYCWGDGSQGQIGASVQAPAGRATLVQGFKGWFARVAAGTSSTCAVEHKGTVWCVGSGSMLAGAQDNPRTALQVPGISDAIDVSILDGHACVLRWQGKVSCWGHNADGELGVPASAALATPAEVVGLGGAATQVAVGQGYSCALLADQTIRCWGSNRRGQLGIGVTPTAASPAAGRVLGITSALALGAGANHVCAMLEAGYVNCWGMGEGTANGICQPWGAYYPGESYQAPRFNIQVCAGAGSSTPYAVQGLGPLQDAALVMDWAEQALPATFPFRPRTVPERVESLYWRDYGGGRYLGINGHASPRLFYLGPDTGGQAQDLGPLTQWVREATKGLSAQSRMQFQSFPYVAGNCSIVVPLYVRRGDAAELARLIPTSVRVEKEGGAFVELAISVRYGVLPLLTTEAGWSALDVYQDGQPVPPGKMVEPVYAGLAGGCPQDNTIVRSGDTVDVLLFYTLDGKKGQLRTRATLGAVS
jgi:alpha-tubulin suppressor-like RCC1 family protein